MSSTPSAKRAALNSGRGSRPGFSSSFRMSRTVGTPNFSSVNWSGLSARRKPPSPISALIGLPVAPTMRSTTGYASGCTEEASSGSSPSAMRRKPAHCSKVLSPSRGTLSRSLRRLNGPLSSRWRTMFSATLADNPDTRDSSAAEAVLTWTPTALTQSSTRASSARARRYWSTSCWYWPTPIAFGSILTSSASGSCRRRAIDTAPRSDTSSCGNSLAANSDAEYTDAPASLTTIFSSVSCGFCLIRSAASLSVSRLAVPLPIAISSTPCCVHSCRSVCSDWSHCLRGSCG